jgi:hypothetical protein
MGVGTIPVSEILVYAEAFGFADRDEFLSRIRAADQVFMEWQQKKTAEPRGPDTAAEAAEKFGIQLPEE